ncbi:MAG: cytochrome c oxidase subunit 2, partial [Myxococcaceae bacterium]|nr:cytochrome c oxidase subunit 2 [Myxococcaceae bacterium]
MPPDHSADGHHVDALLRVTLGLTGAVGLAFLAALAFVVYRARRRTTALPAAPTTPAVVLGLALLVFGVVDLALATASRRAALGPAPADALRIEVVAQQWAWRFRYAGPDEAFGTPDDVVTLNDLRVPVGRAVALQMRSLDVVHGLFLPTLRARLEAFPGRTARTWFRPAREGRGELACSVLCGAAHYQMRGEVAVLSTEQYRRWMAGLVDDQQRRAAAGA